MSETDTSVRRLSRLTGISRRTLENWRYGHALRPRHVENVLQIARALHLSAAETDRLLEAAGHPSLAELQKESDTLPAKLLLDWQLPPNTLRGQKSAALPADHNLPAATTPFLGRQAMCANLAGLLRNPNARLVTVSGLGGVGKTRLALETARTLIGRFDHGIYFVPLDNVNTADGFWGAILDGLHIPNDGVNLPQKLVVDYLHNKQILLLLDNFEHLLSLKGTIADLLDGTQRLRLLVTSRQVLDLRAEYLFPIGGLSYKEGPQSPAYQLYVQTAQRRLPGYKPSAATALDIEALAEAVDGLPLALELAATWRDVLDPKQVLQHMRGSLQHVRHPVEDRPSRHHNLWNLFDYSWRMLQEDDQRAALRISILHGSFSPETALAMANCQPEILKKLIQSSVVRQAGDSRLMLHPLVRQFLAEKGADAGHDIQELEDHFTDVILHWTAAQSRMLRQTFKAVYYQNLHREWQHIERAWWLAVERQRFDLLERCLDLLFYFEARGTFAQGYEFFAATCQHVSAANKRIIACLEEAQAFMSARLLELPRALRLAKRSLQTLEELGAEFQNGTPGMYDRLVLATADHAIKQTAFSAKDKERLRKITDGYLDKFTEIALALQDGVVACNRRAYAKATADFERALKIGGQDAYVMPILRCFLGIALRSQGQVNGAHEEFTIALQRALELEIYPAVIGATYELCLLQGDDSTTEDCWAALEQLAREMGSPHTVGRIAIIEAMQYLNLGFRREANMLTRIGLTMLWPVAEAGERARVLAAVVQSYIAFGLIRAASQLVALVSPNA